MVVAVPYEYMPVMGAVMAFLALQVVAVAGRVYVRAFMVRAFGIDDAACVVTLVCKWVLASASEHLAESDTSYSRARSMAA